MKEQQTLRPKGRKVFLIHGRDLKVRDELAKYLDALSLSHLDWTAARQLAIEYRNVGSPTTLEIVHSGMAAASALIVILNAEDYAHLREDLWIPGVDEHDKRSMGQPRQNVLIEVGMALALYPRHTFLVKIGAVRPASDLAGIEAIDLGKIEGRRQLKDALASVCHIQPTGDYLEAGRFVEDLRSLFQSWLDSNCSYKRLLPESVVVATAADAAKLEPELAAYALVSAIQQGTHVTEYLLPHRESPSAVTALMDVITESPHRAPRARAAKALEAMPPDLVNRFADRLLDNPDCPHTAVALLDAVKSRSVSSYIATRGKADLQLSDEQMGQLMSEFQLYPTRPSLRLFGK